MPCSKCHQVSYQKEPKILFFDTENSTNEGRYYGSKFETRIIKVTKYWEFLMFSYAWGDGKVHVVQSWDERELVQKMHQLLRIPYKLVLNYSKIPNSCGIIHALIN